MEEMSFFDTLAAKVSDQVSRAWCFTVCVLMVVIWAPTMLFMDINTSQLIINTLTTIITFLMVALLQNAQKQFENSTNIKLDAILDKLDRKDLVGIEKEVGT